MDPIRNDIQKLPLRKGSLLIWHSAIPHGTFPNDSNRFRLIQYMKMAPASYPHVVPFYQSNSPFRPMYPFPEDVQLTELGQKIYGFKPWKPTPEVQKSRWCVLLWSVLFVFSPTFIHEPPSKNFGSSFISYLFIRPRKRRWSVYIQYIMNTR